MVNILLGTLLLVATQSWDTLLWPTRCWRFRKLVVALFSFFGILLCISVSGEFFSLLLPRSRGPYGQTQFGTSFVGVSRDDQRWDESLCSCHGVLWLHLVAHSAGGLPTKKVGVIELVLVDFSIKLSKIYHDLLYYFWHLVGGLIGLIGFSVRAIGLADLLGSMEQPSTSAPANRHTNFKMTMSSQ